MARVPYMTRDQLDATGQAVWDKIASDRNIAEPSLQFRALIHSAQSTGHLTSLGAQLRYHAALPENLKEIIALAVSREWNSGIEWTAHVPLATAAGVGAATIEAIHKNKPVSDLPAADQTLVLFVRQLLRDKNVADSTFEAAVKLLGSTQAVVDLVLICSYYSAITIAQIALKPDMAPGKASTL